MGARLSPHHRPSAIPVRRRGIALHALDPLQQRQRRTVARHRGERRVEPRPRVVKAARPIRREAFGIAAAQHVLLRGRDGTSGVDWSQATNIAKALLLSPLFDMVPADEMNRILEAFKPLPTTLLY